MLSLTYTKEDRGVADQVYSNALFDGYMNLIDGYAPWYSVVVQTWKQLKQEKISGFLFPGKKNYDEGNINAPILENLIIVGRNRL